jgi:hypothetical protein
MSPHCLDQYLPTAELAQPRKQVCNIGQSLADTSQLIIIIIIIVIIIIIIFKKCNLPTAGLANPSQRRCPQCYHKDTITESQTHQRGETFMHAAACYPIKISVSVIKDTLFDHVRDGPVLQLRSMF